jgi:multidrug efflux pump subunit AcrA (membrane-fusion protein)
MTRRNLILLASAAALAGLVAAKWAGRPATEAEEQESPEGRQLVAAVAGEFKPFEDVDVHAKVAGYVRKIYVDVGDHGKEGQTLAVLEVRELAAQLSGADAARGRAWQDSESAYERLGGTRQLREQADTDARYRLRRLALAFTLGGQP